MKVTFVFSNIDENLFTPEECSVTMDLDADNERTLFILATHMKKVVGADHFIYDRESHENISNT